jgi:CheY-like chemotaxis protein
MEDIKILAVDDDVAITQQIRDLLEGQEIDGHRILVDVENDFEASIAHLQEKDYDVVILDVYRGDPSEGNTDQPGKEILEQIKLSVPIAVIFYTGLTAHVEDCASDIVRVVSKTTAGGLEAELTALIQTGLPLIRKRIAGHTREVLRKYYWDVVDNHPDYIKISGDDALLEYLLLRQLAATLNREGVSKIFGKTISDDKVHPLSFYICPPAQDDLYEMGDILQKQDDNSFHVILTPSCDLANKKADYVLLVPAIPLSLTPEYTSYKGNKSNANKEKLIRVIGSKNGDRFFFLPRNDFIGMADMVLDFQQGTNYQITEAGTWKLAGFTKAAKIDDPFAQDMLARFVRNKNRPGTPDLDTGHVMTYLDAEIDATT